MSFSFLCIFVKYDVFLLYTKKQVFHGRILLHIWTISVFRSHTFRLLTVYNLCIFNKLLNVDIWLKTKKLDACSVFFHQSFCYRDKSTTVICYTDIFTAIYATEYTYLQQTMIKHLDLQLIIILLQQNHFNIVFLLN